MKYKLSSYTLSMDFSLEGEKIIVTLLTENPSLERNPQICNQVKTSIITDVPFILKGK